MEEPQNISYEQIVSKLDRLSGNDLHGEKATALTTERINQIDEMMDLTKFEKNNGKESNKKETISEEDINNGRTLMGILHTDPLILIQKSESYHQKMKERFDTGYFNDDIHLAVRTFLNYVSEKDTNKEQRTVILPDSQAIFSVGPGYFDKEKNEVYFNNINGDCVDEESLRAFLKRRLT